jgi:transcriptional regulator with XRE-family HTH domain
MTTATLRPLHIPSWTLGDRLRKVRREVGMTQAEAAEACGLDREAWAKWELNKTLPRNQVVVAEAVETAFGVPAWWVLGLPQPGPVSATGRYRTASPQVTMVRPLQRVA